MELIDKRALLRIMEERKKPEFGEDDTKERYRYVQWLTDYHAILTAPVAEVPHWIPVTERLPEPSVEVLTTCWNATVGGTYISVAWMHKDGTWCFRENVLAWMPLPEPYKEGE